VARKPGPGAFADEPVRDRITDPGGERGWLRRSIEVIARPSVNNPRDCLGIDDESNFLTREKSWSD
jgi:hypothetical protein